VADVTDENEIPPDDDASAEEWAAFARRLRKARDEKIASDRLGHYKPYAKQQEFHELGALPVYERLFMAGNQLGKEVRFDEPVLTPTGWVRICDIRVGDEVIAGDGSVTEVTGVFPQGVKPLVEIEFCYGTKVIAGFDHQWKALRPADRFTTRSRSLPRADNKRPSGSVPNPTFGQWSVLTTQAMRAAYGDHPNPKYRHAVPACGPCELRGGATPIDGYVLGMLLGDGGLTKGVQFSSNDPEMVEALRLEADRFDCALRASTSCKFSHFVVGRTKGKNALLDTLRELDVMHGAADKKVPEAYLWASPAVRLAVLQGLMDTDGTCEKSGAMTFTSISKPLADDVAFLARSFGAKCHTRSRVTSFTYKGEKKLGKRSWTVTLRLPHVPVFRLQRKLDRCVRPVSTSDHHLIVGFRDVEPDEAWCISVAHPDRTYVLRDFIVTHNTFAGAAETAMHLTGRYPDWWKGRRFDKPISALAGSESADLTKKGAQRLLVGPPETESAWGTGYIPRDAILDTSRKAGVPDALDTVVVKHVNGGASTISFKSYDQGRAKWQADTVDWVWFDEEPPEDVYSEGRTRTNATKGSVILTFTPLQGMSNVVRRFLNEKSQHRAVIRMTIHDAEHYTDEDRERIIAGYLDHERDARVSGIPILGSGRIFPVSDAQILVAPFHVPAHWPRIGGLDFGWDHPTGAVELAWDRDTDVVYVLREHRASKLTPDQHSLIIGPKKWGKLKWSWPHDGHVADKGTGQGLAKQYKAAGLDMLQSHALWPDGSNSTEAGVMDMLQRMNDGRWKVFDGLCPLWMEEFRMYHRDEGKIVKEDDDLLCASRYALMMLRYSRIVQDERHPFGFYDRKSPVAVGTGEVNW
jgi:phage terminase large subunit-like protein